MLGNASAIGRAGSSVPESTVRRPYILTAFVRRIFLRKPGCGARALPRAPELSGPIAI